MLRNYSFLRKNNNILATCLEILFNEKMFVSLQTPCNIHFNRSVSFCLQVIIKDRSRLNRHQYLMIRNQRLMICYIIKLCRTPCVMHLLWRETWNCRCWMKHLNCPNTTLVHHLLDCIGGHTYWPPDKTAVKVDTTDNINHIFNVNRNYRAICFIYLKHFSKKLLDYAKSSIKIM